MRTTTYNGIELIITGMPESDIPKRLYSFKILHNANCVQFRVTYPDGGNHFSSIDLPPLESGRYELLPEAPEAFVKALYPDAETWPYKSIKPGDTLYFIVSKHNQEHSFPLHEHHAKSIQDAWQSAKSRILSEIGVNPNEVLIKIVKP